MSTEDQTDYVEYEDDEFQRPEGLNVEPVTEEDDIGDGE